MQKKSVKNRVMAFFMAVLMCLGMIQVNTTEILAAENTSKMDSTDLADHLDGERSTVSINGTTVTTGSAIDIGTAKDNNKVSIHLAWSFTDQHVPDAEHHVLTYQLPQGMNFKERRGSLSGYGTYTIAGDTITIDYDNEDFYTMAAREGFLDLEGSLTKEDLGGGEEGDHTYEFLGLGSYTIHTDRDESTDGVKIKKTGGKVSGDIDAMTSEFQLKITASGEQTAVIVSDKMDDNLTLDGDVHFFTDEACTQPYDGAALIEKDAHSFSYRIAQMADHETIYAKYTVKVDKNIYLDNKGKNKASVTSDEQKKPESSSKDIEISPKNWINKWGQKTDNNEISWVIEINPAGDFDISGSIISDTLSDSACQYVDGSFSSDVPGLTEAVWKSVLSEGKSYTIPEGASRRYLIKYRTTTGNVNPTKVSEKKNTATIYPWGQDKGFDASASAWVGSQFNYIEKECLTTQPQSKKVQWRIKVHVPEGGMDNLIVKDILPDGMTCDLSSVVITPDSANVTPELVTENGRNVVKFAFGNVAQGDVVIELETAITNIPENTANYRNHVDYFNGTERKGSAEADYTYRYNEPMQKSGDWTYGDSNPKARWLLEIKPVSQQQGVTEAKKVTIEDTLPKYTRYVEGSLLVCMESDWQKKTNISGVTVKDNGDGTLTFEISGEALEKLNTSTEKLKIWYDTKVSDLEGFKKDNPYGGQLPNRAKITIDDVTYAEKTADMWKNISESRVIEKKGNYNRDTAPNAYYKIIVNQDELDLNPKGDTLTLIDTMGSALDYQMNSLKIDGKQADGDQVYYDQKTRTLTITVPDEKKVTVTYAATVNLSIKAEDGKTNQFTGDEGSNTCKLVGGNHDQGTSKKTLHGEVLSSWGESSGKNVRIRVYKYDEADQTKALAGTEFTLNQVSCDSNFETVKNVARTVTVKTGKDGYAEFTKCAAEGKKAVALSRNLVYEITETAATDGYIADSTPYYVVFRESGISGANIRYPKKITGRDGKKYDLHVIDQDQDTYTYMVANNQAEDISISKVDAADSSELAGAQLKITDKDGETVAKWTSSDTPKKVKLGAGTYTLTEIAAPDGYAKAKSITFTVGENGKVIRGGAGDYKVVMEDKPLGKLVVTKTIAGLQNYETADAVKTISFEVTGNGKTLHRNLSEFDIDEETGTYRWEIRDLESGSYTVKETAGNVKGYNKTVTYRLETSSDVHTGTKENENAIIATVSGAKTTTVSYTNTYAPKDAQPVEFSKVDITSEKEIAGAALAIHDQETGARIAEWISGEDGYNDDMSVKTHTVKLADGRYIFSETAAPDGYQITSQIIFTVEDGKVTEVLDKDANPIAHDGNKLVLKDRKAPGFAKVDAATGKQIAGAKLEITDEAGKTAASWTTEEKTHYVELAAGTYTLTETAAPDGYKTADPLTFTVDACGRTDLAGNIVVMEDEAESYQEVVISKVDATGSGELEGADLVIRDESGAVVSSWTSGKEAHKIKLTAGTYTLTETAAPDGYQTAESITFTVGEDGKVTGGSGDHKVTMIDEAVSRNVKISKIDATGRQEIRGAELTITDKAGETVAAWVSEAGKTHTVELPAGTYTLTEVTAPDGYEKAESVEFTVQKDGTVVQNGKETDAVVMEDMPKPGKLVITKTLEGTVSDEEAKQALRFEVKDNATGKTSSYTLNDFTRDAQTGIYTLELEKVSGGYTVTETASAIRGYGEAKVSYTINGGEPNARAEAVTTVGKDKTTVVAFKDTYSKEKEYPVVISKVDVANSKELAGAHLEILDADGKTIRAWVSGEDGYNEDQSVKAHEISLPAGTYTLKETVAPEDYLTAEAVKFTVDENGVVSGADDAVSGNRVVMKDQRAEGTLVITKTVHGDVTREEAEGKLKFEVSDGVNTTEYYLSQFTYDETAKLWTLKLPEKAGGYRVKEIYTDITGYTFTGASYTIDAGTSQKGVETPEVAVRKNEETVVAYTDSYDNVKYDVEISKVDATNSEEIAGAELTVTRKADNTVIDRWISEADQTHKVKLEAGTYVLTEVRAPEHYDVAESIEFTVEKTDQGTLLVSNPTSAVSGNKITMKDNPTDEKKGTLVIKKTIQGAVTRAEAEGSLVFTVTENESGRTESCRLSSFTYDEDAKNWTKTLVCVPGGYTVTEEVTDITGYKLAEVAYRIGDDNEVQGNKASVTVEKETQTTVTYRNRYETKTYEAEISKVDATDSKELAGAKLLVRNADTNANIASWISGEDGKNADGSVKTHKVSLKPGNYILTEITAPDGYEIAESINFTVSKDGKIAGFENNKVVMKDRKKPGTPSTPGTPNTPNTPENGGEHEVTVSKVDASNNSEIAGAQFAITSKKTGDVVAAWVSGTDGYYENGSVKTHQIRLTEGDYTMTEVSAPEGYGLADPIDFSVGKDGKVVGGSGETKVTMADNRLVTPDTGDDKPDSKPGSNPTEPSVRPGTPVIKPATTADGNENSQTKPQQPQKDAVTVKDGDVQENEQKGKDDVPKTGVFDALAGIWRALFTFCAGLTLVQVIARMLKKRKGS